MIVPLWLVAIWPLFSYLWCKFHSLLRESEINRSKSNTCKLKESTVVVKCVPFETFGIRRKIDKGN